MSEMNMWKVKGAKKDYLLILFLGLCIWFAWKAKDLFWLIGSILLFAGKLYSLTKYYIKITDLGIEYFMSLARKTVMWKEINGCFSSDFKIIINKSNNKSIVINKALVQESENFSMCLNEKLEAYLKYKCPRCGSQLRSEEMKCPYCGWTLENEKRGIAL